MGLLEYWDDRLLFTVTLMITSHNQLVTLAQELHAALLSKVQRSKPQSI
jgi:hypothetical protein